MYKILNLSFLFLILLNFSNYSKSEEIKKIKIQFSPETFLKLKRNQQNAYAKKITEYNPKKLRVDLIDENNQFYSSKINLDGLGMEHFNNKDVLKSTIKYRLKKNSEIYGFREFRLIDPKPAYYDVPFLYNLFLDHFNLATRKVSLIKVYTNLSSKIYIKILEESFGNNFISRNNFQKGLVFKFSIYNKKGHKALEKNRNNEISNEEYINIFYQNIKASNLKAYNRKNSELDLEIKRAKDIFQKYLNKEKKVHEVFDIDSTVKFFFMNTIWGEMHSALAHNIRFYFDPINNKFFLVPSDPFYPINIKNNNNDKIPLPFTLNSQNEFGISYFYNADFEKEWFKNLMDDKEFRSSYLNLLLNLDKLELKSLLQSLENYKIKFERDESIEAKKNLKSNINELIKLTNRKENIKLVIESLKEQS